MMSKTHKSISLATCSTILCIASTRSSMTIDTSNAVFLICGAAGAVIGSLICDIDEPNSTIGRKLWFITFPIALIKFLISLISLFCYGKFGKLLDNINKSVDHRGITHSIITWISLNMCYALLYRYFYLHSNTPFPFYLGIFLLCVSIGNLTHLIADFCSGNGIPLLEPFSHTRMGTRELTGFAISYNGIGEFAIRMICLLTIAVEFNYQLIS